WLATPSRGGVSFSSVKTSPHWVNSKWQVIATSRAARDNGLSRPTADIPRGGPCAMPIAVTCPHCQTRYPKIPANFAGKTVKCKKEDCRQDFLVPVPLSAAELEAAALAALADTPAQQA